MKFKVILISLLILVLITSCSNISNLFNGGGSSPSGKGLTVSFKEAPAEGSTLNENEQFSVLIDISNYIVSDKDIRAKLCLSDLASDSYGGVRSAECKDIVIPPGERTDNNIFPGQSPEPLRFPAQGFYSYHNLDPNFPQSNQLLLDLAYEINTISTATGCYSMPQVSSKCKGTQSLSINQQEAPLQVSKITLTQATISNNEVNLNVEITVSKNDEGQVYTSGKYVSETEPSIGFEAALNRMPLKCTGLSNNFIKFRQTQNEKIIKCTASRMLSQEFENANIDIALDYGFLKIIKGPKFNLKKEEAYV